MLDGCPESNLNYKLVAVVDFPFAHGSRGDINRKVPGQILQESMKAINIFLLSYQCFLFERCMLLLNADTTFAEILAHGSLLIALSVDHSPINILNILERPSHHKICSSYKHWVVGKLAQHLSWTNKIFRIDEALIIDWRQGLRSMLSSFL